jgi:hypothetical protein
MARTADGNTEGAGWRIVLMSGYEVGTPVRRFYDFDVVQNARDVGLGCQRRHEEQKDRGQGNEPPLQAVCTIAPRHNLMLRSGRCVARHKLERRVPRRAPRTKRSKPGFPLGFLAAFNSTPNCVVSDLLYRNQGARQAAPPAPPLQQRQPTPTARGTSPGNRCAGDRCSRFRLSHRPGRNRPAHMPAWRGRAPSAADTTRLRCRKCGR